jgi:hypothetical protein
MELQDTEALRNTVEEVTRATKAKWTKNQSNRIGVDMTKYYTYIYPEIYKRNELGQEPEYPKACPACGAKTKSPEFDHYDGPVYECGGQYTFKPQIQNHTNKWWGTCPIEREKERKRSGRVCNGCGEKDWKEQAFQLMYLVGLVLLVDMTTLE